NVSIDDIRRPEPFHHPADYNERRPRTTRAHEHIGFQLLHDLNEPAIPGCVKKHPRVHRDLPLQSIDPSGQPTARTAAAMFFASELTFRLPCAVHRRGDLDHTYIVQQPLLLGCELLPGRGDGQDGRGPSKLSQMDGKSEGTHRAHAAARKKICRNDEYAAHRLVLARGE